MGAWLKGELVAVLDRILLPGSRSRARGLFDAAVVAQLIAAHRANRVDGTDGLLALLNLEIWAGSIWTAAARGRGRRTARQSLA